MVLYQVVCTLLVPGSTVVVSTASLTVIQGLSLSYAMNKTREHQKNFKVCTRAVGVLFY